MEKLIHQLTIKSLDGSRRILRLCLMGQVLLIILAAYQLHLGMRWAGWAGLVINTIGISFGLWALTRNYRARKKLGEKPLSKSLETYKP